MEKLDFSKSDFLMWKKLALESRFLSKKTILFKSVLQSKKNQLFYGRFYNKNLNILMSILVLKNDLGMVGYRSIAKFVQYVGGSMKYRTSYSWMRAAIKWQYRQLKKNATSPTKIKPINSFFLTREKSYKDLLRPPNNKPIWLNNLNIWLKKKSLYNLTRNCDCIYKSKKKEIATEAYACHTS